MTELKITENQVKTLIKVLDYTILKTRGDIAMRTPTGRKIKGLGAIAPEYHNYCLNIIADLTPILTELKRGDKQ